MSASDFSRRVALWLLVLPLLLSIVSCGGRDPDRATDPAGLAFALASAGRARVVVDGYALDASVKEALHSTLLERHGLERAEPNDRGAPRCVLATVDSALGTELLEEAGIARLESGGFAIAGRTFAADGDVVRLSLRDPARPGLPLVAWIANRPAMLARVAESTEFSPRARFEGYRGGRLVLWGRLEGRGPVIEGDVEARRAPWLAGERGRVLDLPWRAADEAAASLFADELQSLEQGRGNGPSGWTLVLHSNAVDFAAVFGTLSPLVAEPLAREVHRLFVPGTAVPTLDALRRGIDERTFALESVVVPLAGPQQATRDVTMRGAGLLLPSDRIALAQIGAAFDELAELGADTVLLRHLVPLVDDPAPSFGRTWRSAATGAAGVHTDGELWFAAAAARTAGLSVVLEPSFLTTASSDLVARRKRSTDAERAAFEDTWARALESAARRATRIGARALVLGSDLPTITRTSTRTGADDDALSEVELAVREHLGNAWRLGIDRARRAFAGALLYAPRDLSELQRSAFTDGLDGVAIQHYPSFVDFGGERRASGFLGTHRWSLGRVREVAGNRPLVVFGTGMPAASDSTLDPRLPRGGFDEGVQHAHLEAFAIALHELEPPVAGIILWEWTAQPARRGGRGFDLRRDGLKATLRAIFAPR